MTHYIALDSDAIVCESGPAVNGDSRSRPILKHKDTIADIGEDDPRLNPDCSNFDAYIWDRVFMRAYREGGLKVVKAGYTCEDLIVFGSGPALRLQSTVTSILTVPFSWLGGLLRPSPASRTQILHGFDGDVGAREMLLVLGRPGSGCTTLLKTICGQLANLEIGNGPSLLYNGVPQTQMMGEFKGDLVYNGEGQWRSLVVSYRIVTDLIQTMLIFLI